MFGKRKIETLKADEAAGTDANVKELRRHQALREDRPVHRHHLERNTPALGPVAEELKLLTIFVDGCTDFLFDKAVPNPRTSSGSPTSSRRTGSTCGDRRRAGVAASAKIAHIHPDYSLRA